MSTESKTDQRGKALELAVSQIEKQFGKGSIMRLGGDIKLDVQALPTGIATVDKALGVGGMPRGRVIEVYGPEASGKTSLALSVAGEVQGEGGVAAFIDAEHAFDPTYAKLLGVKVEDLLFSQPDTGEQALEIAETLVRSNAVDLIIIDSVAALTPRAEIEGQMGDSHMGLQARLMSQALRKLTAAISKSKSCVIFINQIREKIGVMFGNPEVTPGGRALKFYSSIRVDLRRIGKITHEGNIIGGRIRARIVKNKVAPPFKEAQFDILQDGISKIGSLMELALTEDIVEKAGSWFSFEGEKIGQGRAAAIKFLEENPPSIKKIKKALKGKEDK